MRPVTKKRQLPDSEHIFEGPKRLRLSPLKVRSTVTSVGPCRGKHSHKTDNCEVTHGGCPADTKICEPFKEETIGDKGGFKDPTGNDDPDP